MQRSHLPAGPTAHIPGIDGLRAVAVVSVMLYHLRPTLLPGGFSGVDVFFVISGYVVSASLARDGDKGFLHFLGDFYARRIVRIFPALVACLVITSFATMLFIPEAWLSIANQQTGRYAFFGLSNFALIWSSDGYFSPRVEFNPFVQTWSLAVEEQFYLFFPLVFFTWLRLKERQDRLRFLGHGLLVTLLSLSLIHAAKTTVGNPDHAYYLLPSRFWELASGALLFQLHARGWLIPNSRVLTTGMLMSGGLLIAAAFTYSKHLAFPFPGALLSVTGSVLLIAGVTSSPTARSPLIGLLDNPITVLIGKLSYSLYLWHWAVYVLFRWTVGLESALLIASAIGLTIIFACCSFYGLENPLRQSHIIKNQPTWRITVGGLATIFCCWWVAGGIFAAQPRYSLSVTKDRTTWFPYAWPLQANPNATQCQVKSEVRPLDGATVQIFSRTPCTASPLQSRRLFVMGDSHAGAYRTLLYQLTEEHGVEVSLYNEGGCSVANLLVPTSALNPICRPFIKAAMTDMQSRAAPGDIVWLASLRMNRLSFQDRPQNEAIVFAGQRNAKADADRALARQEATDFLHALEKIQVRVVIDAPKPVFKTSPFRCSDWFNSMNPFCQPGFTLPRTFLLDLRKPVMDSLVLLSALHPELIVWDPFEILCPTEVCSAFDHDKPLFLDGDHLSAYGNRVLYPSFLALLTRVWSPGVREHRIQMK